MYGPKRIKIEKTGVIVLAGDKSYIPIGRYHSVNGTLSGRLRYVNSWELSLNETNSVDFVFYNVSELRKFVKTTYENELK